MVDSGKDLTPNLSIWESSWFIKMGKRSRVNISGHICTDTSVWTKNRALLSEAEKNFIGRCRNRVVHQPIFRSSRVALRRGLRFECCDPTRRIVRFYRGGECSNDLFS